MRPFEFFPGHLPLLVSIPHAGTYLPDDIQAAMTAEGKLLRDTDWHLDELYNFVWGLGVNVVLANYSRYVVDLNRPPDNSPLYAGATTGLTPDVSFDGRPIFEEERIPDRTYYLDTVWRPYHSRIQTTLEESEARYGYAVLFDVHSIRSCIPRLFEGRLPDFNIGTNDTTSIDVDLQARLEAVCAGSRGYTSMSNGRFKGGYTTRQYGQPDQGVHAVQLELSQRTYMNEEPPFTYREDLAEQVRPILRSFVQTLTDWHP